MPDAARRGYAVCTTIRSGSTWLAELLAGTGRLGRPAEYFSTKFQKRVLGAGYPEAVREQAAFALEHGSTPNGVYGFKIYPMQLDGLSVRLRWTAWFPDLRFVHLGRRDLLGQAISRARVNQTLQWRSTMPAAAEPRYDGAAILGAMRETVAQDARWQLFFARNGIAPLRLVYEDALLAPEATVDAVARLVGVEGPVAAAPERIAVAVQRDGVSAEWRARFLAEYGDRDAMDAPPGG
ncbi:hypothetical protein D3273_10210 [Lichenibacterium minor]|uniref:Sulphotransferase Stf0 domain-containing protein n=1 Tax=Lichenibacterium minor TaxID=2316528 RepID=A0A4Q2UA82_9HYPH|nr:Stf0 family sulfotransferase [Lichenibacterium minor]RYC32091.1 hypothetical protein D3273_10210 [Lichenibacterium minor]